MILIFGLFGCSKQKPQSQTNVDNKVVEISILNQVAEADVWIIPDTEKNRKTSVWGKATLPKLDVQESKNAYVEVLADTDMYLIRMIDTAKMYYATDGVKLSNNQSIVIRKGNEGMLATVEVHSDDGTLLAEYEMFVAKL